VRTLIMLRELVDGTTSNITVVNNEKINDVLIHVANEMNLQGALNVQLRLTESGPQIFEINPRFSGTLVMRHLLGFKDLYWYVEYMINKTPLPTYDVSIGSNVVRVDDWHSYKVTIDKGDKD